jgi:N-acetylglucosaminyl-diphospho-decaprenol L-rhamnosyltransferase
MGHAVTVAVVSWNTRDLLAACLESLEPDASSGLADVWVVDNASSDGSADLVRSRFPWATLVASGENLGYGRAVNLVARETRTPWLAPSNADVRVAPGALERLVSEGERHAETAVIAPRLVLPDGSTQHSAYPLPTVGFTLAFTLGVPRIHRRLAEHWCLDGAFDPDRAREIPWAVGAFLLVRRSAWDEVGGFDDAQWMYAEDLDLGWRLHRAGWRARYEPAARVDHDESAATRQVWGDERHVQWYASTYAWHLRRRGVAVTRLIATLNVIGALLRVALHTGRALLGSRDAVRMRGHAVTAARAHTVGLRSSAALRRHR